MGMAGASTGRGFIQVGRAVEQAIGFKANGSHRDPPLGRRKDGVSTAEKVFTAKKKTIARRAARVRLAMISDL